MAGVEKRYLFRKLRSTRCGPGLATRGLVNITVSMSMLLLFTFGAAIHRLF